MDPGSAHHVALPVPDLEVGVAWCRTRFEHVEYARGGWDGHAFVRLAPADHLRPAAMLELIRGERTGDDVHAVKRPEITVRVPDADRAIETLVDGGVDVETAAGPGGRDVHRFAGPGDNVIGLIERPVGRPWGIDLVTLFHADPAAAIDWYVDTLGWTLEEQQGRACVAPPGTAQSAMRVAVRQGDSRTRDADPDPWTDGHVAIACDDLGAFVDTLARRGVDRTAMRISCGGTRASIAAVPGTPIELVERPADP